jgi:hypothetical protein
MAAIRPGSWAPRRQLQTLTVYPDLSAIDTESIGDGPASVFRNQKSITQSA